MNKCLLIMTVMILLIGFLPIFLTVKCGSPERQAMLYNSSIYVSVKTMGKLELIKTLQEPRFLEIIDDTVIREDNTWIYSCKYGIPDNNGKYIIKKYQTKFIID